MFILDLIGIILKLFLRYKIFFFQFKRAQIFIQLNKQPSKSQKNFPTTISQIEDLIVNLTDSNFKAIIENNELVLVIYSSQFCDYCGNIFKEIRQISNNTSFAYYKGKNITFKNSSYGQR